MKIKLTKKQQRKLNRLSKEAVNSRAALRVLADEVGARERVMLEYASAIVRKAPGCASLENVHHIGIGRVQKNAWIAVISVESAPDEEK